MKPTGFFVNVGGVKTDLIGIFDARRSAKISDTGFKSFNNNNLDLADIFEPYTSGTKAATTKYVVYSTGLDLCDVFARFPLFPTASGTIISSSTERFFWISIYDNWVLAVRNMNGGTSNSIYYSNDYGKSWTTYTNAGWSSLSWRGVASYGTNAVACSTTSVWVTSNKTSWTNVTPGGSSSNLFGVSIYENRVLLADGTNGLYSYTLESSWIKQTDTDITYPRSVSITKNGANYIVVVCCTANSALNEPTNVIYCSNFNTSVGNNVFTSAKLKVNQQYTVLAPPGCVSMDGLNGVCCSFTGNTPASTGFSRIKYTTDGGALWTDSKSGGANISNALYVCSLSGNIAIAGGYSSTYFISTDTGMTWTSLLVTNPLSACAVYNDKIVAPDYSANAVKVLYGDAS